MKNGNYILNHAPLTYPGKKYRGKYVYEHRLVWWMQTGDLADGFDIHHKNGDERDNSFTNLQKIEHSEHTAEHSRARGHGPVAKQCQQCGVDYAVPFNSRKRKFCSRPCQYESFRVVSSVEPKA